MQSLVSLVDHRAFLALDVRFEHREPTLANVVARRHAFVATAEQRLGHQSHARLALDALVDKRSRRGTELRGGIFGAGFGRRKRVDRSMDAITLSACRVQITRWPLIPARMASMAVLPSRISPRKMMLGLHRNMERLVLTVLGDALDFPAGVPSHAPQHQFGLRHLGGRHARWLRSAQWLDAFQVTARPPGFAQRSMPGSVETAHGYLLDRYDGHG